MLGPEEVGADCKEAANGLAKRRSSPSYLYAAKTAEIQLTTLETWRSASARSTRRASRGLLSDPSPNRRAPCRAARLDRRHRHDETSQPAFPPVGPGRSPALRYSRSAGVSALFPCSFWP